MIRTTEQLRALYDPVIPRAVQKQLGKLDAHCCRFISLSPFCVVASAGPAGQLLDASPRGGARGFAKVTDPQTILLPDSGGNNRLDTLENLLRDPRIGLLFMIPGVDETLRINGTARLRDEHEFADPFAQERQRPKLVIEVQVAEAYLHCAKAFMRSGLWQPDSWQPRSELPSMNQMLRDQIGQSVEQPVEPHQDMVARFRQLLADEQTPGA
ncbi:pyridoxamine 5'-phosphate oxidase family protein [Variovorax sp. RHLX14]|uniref:pyridoxamine 5'-phosphate oxidase family protein n=1 Tax=Variovorax sp. RHLX14 TaxID=1259731 RepID=UPI003F47B752